MQSEYLSSSFYLTSPCHSWFGITFDHSLLATLTESKLKPQQTTGIIIALVETWNFDSEHLKDFLKEK